MLQFLTPQKINKLCDFCEALNDQTDEYAPPSVQVEEYLKRNFDKAEFEELLALTMHGRTIYEANRFAVMEQVAQERGDLDARYLANKWNWIPQWLRNGLLMLETEAEAN